MTAPASPRLAPLALSLIMLSSTACSVSAKEDLLMDKVDAREVFADGRVAELADAVADDDASQVHRLAKGVDLGTRGDKSVTLLQWAVLNQSLPCLKALLQEGADPTQQGMDGYTVLHTAAMVDDPAYLDALLKSGANVNAPDADGQTPLSAAITARRDAQFRALLGAGADPNRADSTGDTPLHAAGLINDAGRALALLQAGANPNAKNAQGVGFQKYLFQTRSKLLNEQSRRERDAVQAWLREHGVPIEAGEH